VAKVDFEIRTYEIKMARELNATVGETPIKIAAYIVCKGDEYSVSIYALHDTSPAPDNTVNLSIRSGNIFCPRWQFEWFLDLLRNEKPVFCTLRNDTPKWNSLWTGTEPVGELEV
jgi:hypothetical protein